ARGSFPRDRREEVPAPEAPRRVGAGTQGTSAGSHRRQRTTRQRARANSSEESPMPRITPRAFRAAALAGAASLALTACASVPGANVAAGAPITPQEAQMGAEYHPQFVAEFGGEMTGAQAQYVQQVGQNIAVQSGLANAQSAYTVTLLNSS